MKAVVVGAGLSGLTAAVLLRDRGVDVSVLEQRNHIGGNCYDEFTDGVMLHRYGPHILHTNDKSVWEFLRRFTEFNSYQHKVVARTSRYQALLLSLPYSTHTERQIGRELSDDEIIKTFFVEYSAKMWGRPWSELPEVVTGRVPKRCDRVNYFSDKWQGMPIGGWTLMFNKMVDHIGRENLFLDVCPYEWQDADVDLLVYTGSIDQYHNYSHGMLPYRTLDIEVMRDFHKQDAAVINECSRVPYTRTTDYSWFYPELHVDRTVVTREYPRSCGRYDIPYYPMGWSEAEQYLLTRYRQEPCKVPTLFCGRLGAYKYMNMDQAVANVMENITSFFERE